MKHYTVEDLNFTR